MYVASVDSVFGLGHVGEPNSEGVMKSKGWPIVSFNTGRKGIMGNRHPGEGGGIVKCLSSILLLPLVTWRVK
jgi:hypothetical protein